MAEHTPTPWIVCHPTPSHQATRGWIKSVCKGFPERMVAQATGQETVAEREANAAFIVRAVNSHDALVKALEKARAAIWSGGDTVSAITEIDAALATLALSSKDAP